MRSFCIAALVCATGAITIAACSSSSPAPVATTDSGAAKDTGSSPSDTGSPTDTGSPSDSGGTCSAVGDGGGQYSTGNATCDSCLGSSCCSQFSACVANPACLTALKCTTACVAADGGTTDACGLQCIMMNPDGGADAIGLSTCQSTSCKTQC